MSDYPYQITEETKLGKLTFFVDQTNINLMNSGWVRIFKITVFYNGVQWNIRQDMSIHDPLINNYNHTKTLLTYCSYELVECIMKELELYEI